MKIKLETSNDIRALFRMNLVAAGIDTALENELFWDLEKKPQSASEIANSWNTPPDRIFYLLEILVEIGLLEKDNDLYSPSDTATSFIVNEFTADSWKFLAREARDMYPGGINLAKNITQPQSVWQPLEFDPPDWFKKMKEDDDYAEQFTYMLYDIHKEIAKQISQEIDLEGFHRVMDLGGGSGVISMSLLEEFDNLTAVIIDLPQVCKTGEDITQNFSHKDRISYLVKDFVKEDLPKDFDVILQCDSGIYSEKFFIKVYNALLEGGKYILIANLGIDSAWIKNPDEKLTLGHYLRFLENSLETSEFNKHAIEEVIGYLNIAGFDNIQKKIVSDNLLIIEAHK